MDTQTKETIRLVAGDMAWHIEDAFAVAGLPGFDGFSDEDRNKITEALENVLSGILDQDQTKVLRGGAWCNSATKTQCVDRTGDEILFRYSTVGFRCARNVSSQYRLKILRGGSWDNLPQFVRCANHGYDGPTGRFYFVGFRCARLQATK